MKRTIRQYLQDIIEASNAIMGYTKDLTEEDFIRNNLVHDAVLRELEILGEAVKHIPANIRNKYPNIPWKEIAGMRDILIHEYFGVILQNAWNVVKRDLPILKQQILELQKTLSKET